VVDFFNLRLMQFPVFNMADVFLTVAAAFLIVALLRHPDERRVNEHPAV
jgi:signal peptidase II